VTRRASLWTIFLTVFLDLLGMGLVVPYLPGVARTYGASPALATLLGAAYSLMQLVFVPVWGQLSDRVGRRPVLLVSVGASALGFLFLARADALWMLFAARIWTGVATSNLSVAQAYIADVTPPEDRSKGMGIIGAGIGIGFVLGPVVGGLLEAVSPLHRQGALPAFAAAALGLVNLALALRFLPESHPPERRGAVRRASVLDPERYRAALRTPGVAPALAVNFVLATSFAAMEQTFRLFTEDAFGMSAPGTGLVLGLVGVVMILVQGGLLRPLARAYAEGALVRGGIAVQVFGFLAVAVSPRFGVPVLCAGMAVVAFGSGLTNPSLSAHVSRCTDAASQGAILGVYQSVSAFARVFGPATAGPLYQLVGHSAPYFMATIGMLTALALALALRPVAPPEQPSPTGI
jgi:MFS family permease